MDYESLLRLILGGPIDRERPRSLYEAMRRGLVPKELFAEAVKLLDSYPYPRKPTTSASSGLLHNDPGWDNVIRALEEDR